MSEITIFHYLFLGLMLFIIGFVGAIVTKNIIKVLISIEFMLAGINLNFITFATYCDPKDYDGFVFALFYIAIGAVELAVALYIFYLMFIKKESENIEEYGDL